MTLRTPFTENCRLCKTATRNVFALTCKQFQRKETSNWNRVSPLYESLLISLIFDDGWAVDFLSASKVVTRKRKKIRSLCLRLCKKSETVFAWRRFIFLLGILTANIINKEDVVVNSVLKVSENDEIEVVLSDGSLDCTVNKINKKEV